MATGMIWFLHGAVGTPGDWDPWRGEGTVCVDLHADVAPFAEWAGAFCETVRARDEAPVLVGYSMGGRLALHALLADPALWRGAVLVAAHPGLAEAGERASRLERDLAWAATARALPWADFLAAWNAQPVFAGTVGALPGRPELAPRREAVAAAFDHWSLGRQEDLLPFLGRLDFPVTWIAGERDAKFSALARDAVRNLPQGRLVIVPGAGHRVPWDQPERFRTFVRADPR